jgi:hypothetical protein
VLPGTLPYGARTFLCITPFQTQANDRDINTAIA